MYSPTVGRSDGESGGRVHPPYESRLVGSALADAFSDTRPNRTVSAKADPYWICFVAQPSRLCLFTKGTQARRLCYWPMIGTSSS